MKKKIGTLIEENIMRLAKRKAAEEGRSLSEVIQDALVEYLRKARRLPNSARWHFSCFANDR